MVDDDEPAYAAAFRSDSPEATRALAERLGRLCRGGEILLLMGDLGAGKTCFAQGLALGLGVPPRQRVTSPTFTLHAEYPGRLTLNHLDLYRLDDPCSLESLGLDEMFWDKTAVAAVEWPEILAGGAGPERLEIRIADEGAGVRGIEAAAYGARHGELLREWAAG